MKKRGKILRDTSSGTGLLVVDGRQVSFQLEGVWVSAVAPAVNMTVDVDIDENGKLLSVAAVDDAQLAKEVAKDMLGKIGAQGSQQFNDLAQRTGKPLLIAVGALFLGFFVFSTLNVNVSADYKIGLTLHKLLASLGSSGFQTMMQGGGSSGIGFHSIVMLAAILAPLASFFIENKHAKWGYFAPLLLMLYIAYQLYSGISSAADASSGMASAFGGEQAAKFARDMANSMVKSLLQSIHLGIGFYLSAAASLYLAFTGTIKLLSARA